MTSKHRVASSLLVMMFLGTSNTLIVASHQFHAETAEVWDGGVKPEQRALAQILGVVAGEDAAVESLVLEEEEYRN